MTTSKTPDNPAGRTPATSLNELGNTHMSGQQFAPIKHSELAAGGASAPADRAPVVSHAEFQQSATRGATHLANAKSQASPSGAVGLDTHWSGIKAKAFHSAQEPWGGGTYNAATGKSVANDADAYALTVREPNQAAIRVPANANKQEFGAAMDRARKEYSPQLTRGGEHHLGVFHDADSGHIDIDPVMVVKSQQKAQDVSAANRSLGGAYHFKSGNGYWPPSVKG